MNVRDLFGKYTTPNGVEFRFGDPNEVPLNFNHEPAITLDTHVDVTTDGPDGTRYADFVTRQFIESIFEKNAGTGEMLDGNYFCMPGNMVIVNEATPEIVGRVIDRLIADCELNYYFKKYPLGEQVR